MLGLDWIFLDTSYKCFDYLHSCRKFPWGWDTNPFSIITAVTSGARLPVPDKDDLPAGPLKCFDEYVSLMMQCCMQLPEDRPLIDEVVQRLRSMLAGLVQQRMEVEQPRARTNVESDV